MSPWGAPLSTRTLAIGILATGLLVLPVPAVADPIRTPDPADRMDAHVRAAAGLTPTADGKGRPAPLKTDTAGRVIVYVEGSDPGRLRKAVTDVGGTVSDAQGGRLRAAVPPQGLRGLAASGAVTELRRPEAPVPMEVVSEGAQPSGALAWHANGRGGAGVKVGILDVGFGGLTDARAAGELPDATTVHDGQCGPTEDQQSHGTTIAEIVHDMAPDAQLYLACVADTMDFEDAARWLQSQGVQVVNISMAFPGTGRGHGLPTPNDADWNPATVVGWLRGAGIVVVTAAGNQGDKHMTGPTADPDGNGWMNVSGNAEVQSFNAAAGARVTVELRWDAWPKTTQDLDLYVTRGVAKPTGLNDPNVVIRSIRPQLETTGGLSPTEVVTFDNTGGTAATFYVHVQRKAGASTTMRYDLTVYGSVVGLSYSDPAGSIAEPASSPYTIAVGAITPENAATGGTVERDSGRGPTIDGRIKPDVAGYTNITTFTGGPSPRRGTSVAAAHVTGAAALYKAANPGLDPAELEAVLLDSSTRPGRDNDLGYGVLNVGPPRDPAAPGGSAYTPQPIRRVLDTTTSVGSHPAPLQAGETVTVPIAGLPSDATAVSLTLTASSASAATGIEVFADRPTGAVAVSTVPGISRSATVIATLDPSVKVVRFRNSAGTTHVAADVDGYFSTSSSTATYTPLPHPVRLSQATPTLIGTQSGARTLPVRGVSGIPAEAVAVAVSVTASRSLGATGMRLYSDNWPASPTFTVRTSEKVTFDHLLPIGDDGAIRIGSDRFAVDVTVDVTGWFAPGPGARYVPLRYAAPVFDSRTGAYAYRIPSGPGETRLVRVTAAPRIPYDATAAAFTLSTPRADARSQAAVWSNDFGWSGAPSVSTEAVAPGGATALSGANSPITPLGPTGVVRVRNYASVVDLSINVSGYFVGGQAGVLPAAPGPAGRWAFDEGSGGTAADSVGGRTATWQGGNGWSPGVTGAAGQFDGTRYASTAGPVIRTDQSFTVSAWAYLTSRTDSAVLGQDGVSGSGFYLEFIGSGSGRWSFSALTGDSTTGSAWRALGPLNPPTGAWTHLTGVYDAPAHQLRLYVDGVLVGVSTATLWNAAGAFTVGAAKFGGQRAGWFRGSIDDVRAYQVALSDTDVRELFASYQRVPVV